MPEEFQLTVHDHAHPNEFLYADKWM